MLNRSRISSHSCEFDWSFQGQPYKALLSSVGSNHCAFDTVLYHAVLWIPIRIKLKGRIELIGWIRIRFNLQLTSQNLRNMSLSEHLFYLEARTRIWIQICIKVKGRIRIRNTRRGYRYSMFCHQWMYDDVLAICIFACAEPGIVDAKRPKRAPPMARPWIAVLR